MQTSLFGQAPLQPVALHELPAHAQPRGRLCEFGADYLSDAELLAALLGSGTKELDAVQFAQRVLHDAGGWPGLQRMSVAELRRLPGMTEARVAQLKAALAIGKRLITRPGERRQITAPADVADLLMAEMGHLEHEHLNAVLLNTKNYVIAVINVYVGTINSADVRVGEVFKEALRRNAAALIICHNHPSASCEPSPQDVMVTKQLGEAGRLLGIELLDHLIIGQGSWLSLRERRLGFSD